MVEVRGDSEDVFSHGFICPKATGLKHLTEDGDRLRTPLVRQPDGTFAEATWDEAMAVIDERLSPILEEHGRDAVAVYVGNPSAHNLSALTYGPVWIRALGSKSIFTASTVDQMPKHVSRRADVRRPAVDPRAGRGPHRPPADPREPIRSFPTAACSRRRTCAGGCGRSASAAARSW